MMEQWCRARIILTATTTKKLDVIKSGRASVYQFQLPTPNQAFPRLIEIAHKDGWELTPEVARYIAERSGVSPRHCLDDLWTLSSFKTKFDLPTIKTILASQYNDSEEENHQPEIAPQPQPEISSISN